MSACSVPDLPQKTEIIFDVFKNVDAEQEIIDLLSFRKVSLNKCQLWRALSLLAQAERLRADFVSDQARIISQRQLPKDLSRPAADLTNRTGGKVVASQNLFDLLRFPGGVFDVPVRVGLEIGAVVVD
jgi:hypothetical protein